MFLLDFIFINETYFKKLQKAEIRGSELTGEASVGRRTNGMSPT